MALPASMRFRHRRDIQRVLRYGRRFQTRLGRVCTAPAAAKCGRILFIVPLTAARKSTERNRIKRQLDEWVRRNRPRGLARRDVVVLVSRDAAAVPNSVLINLAQEMCLEIQA